jgi:diguanylate cyclase (GGDEF)-like protein
MSLFKSAYEWFSSIAEKATLPADSDVEKTKKGVLTIIAVIIAFLAIFWGSAYMLLGKPYSGAIPLSYAIISFLSIAYYFATKSFEFFRFSQLLLIFCLPFLLMWSLGGFANGSVVMVWAFFTPLAAMMFADAAHAAKWFYAFLFFTIVSVIIDPWLAASISPMDERAIRVFFVMNMGFGFASIFIVLNYFVKQREQAHEVALSAKKDLEHSNEQLQENETKILQLMMTDWLTGVANRRHLDERLQCELDRVRRYGNTLSVIMTDLDRFKRVNDAYGHIKGDEVINIFTDVLTENVRSADFVARFGGEEFLVMLPETTLAGAELLANRIRESLQTRKIEGIPHPVTASFGVTEALESDEVESVLQRVDQALYEAKESGRNCVKVVVVSESFQQAESQC